MGAIVAGMKPNALSLARIVSHGSQQNKRTGWQRWSGFTLAHLSDGSTRYFPENAGQDAIFADLKTAGVNTTTFRAESAAWEKAHSYPAKPEGAELYQHNYGYEKPVALDRWEWSSTFGRWSRLVTFADGWHGFTYPKVETAAIPA